MDFPSFSHGWGAPARPQEVGRHVADPSLLSLERDLLREISASRAAASPALTALVTTFVTPFAAGTHNWENFCRHGTYFFKEKMTYFENDDDWEMVFECF